MIHRTARPRLAALALATLALAAARPAAAVEAYAATGFPYALVGIAQPINGSFAVRADFGGIAHHAYNRFALLGDWFVASGGLRLSAGATVNTAKATMKASSHDGTITIGGTQYNAPSSTYYVTSELSFPKTTPYVGLGWGHHDSAPGLSFSFDAGASIGTARATPLKASPALASELALNQQGSADLAQENRDFQDSVHKFKAIPQLTLGLGYRF
jgi:hypothetical protein